MATAPDKPERHTQLPENFRALVDSAGRSADIPHYYFNGMIMAQGAADVTIILQLNQQPVTALNCSFTIAKTLSQILSGGISKLEKATGREIMAVDDIVRSFAQMKDADGKPNP